MALDLRPLSIGELFDRAFTLYRRNLWLFVGVTAVPAVFALVITLLMQAVQHVSMQSSLAGAEQGEQAIATVVWLVAGMFVVMVVYWVVYMVALGATTFAVSELYVGRPATVSQAYGRMRSHIGALVVLLMIIGVRVFLVTLAAFVVVAFSSVALSLIHPALAVIALAAGIGLLFLAVSFMMLRYGVAVPALVLEGLKPGQAVKRSIALTKGRLGRVFLLVLCATMVTYAALTLFQGPFWIGAMMVGPDTAQGFWLNVVGAIAGTIGTTFTTPFMIIGLALIYYDARIRQEGLDLELTLAALDARPGMAGA